MSQKFTGRTRTTNATSILSKALPSNSVHMNENRTSQAAREWTENFLRHSSKELAIAEKYLRMEESVKKTLAWMEKCNFDVEGMYCEEALREAISFDPLK